MKKEAQDSKPLLPLNLQFFAGEAEGENLQDGDLQGDNAVDKTETGLTEEKIKAIVENSIKGLLNQKSSLEKQLERNKSLEGLDAEAREQKEKELLIADLQSELQDLRLSGRKAEVAKVLGARNLDASLIDFVVVSDDETECLQRIDALENIFKKMVKAEVDNRLKSAGGTPRGSNMSFDGSITREDFLKMPLSQQAELAKTNKSLYDKLTQR